MKKSEIRLKSENFHPCIMLVFLRGLLLIKYIRWGGGKVEPLIHFFCVKHAKKGEVVPISCIRDWSLITGRGGGLQNGKFAGLKLFAPPPPSRQGKTFRPLPYNMAKNSSYCVTKTTPKLVVPPPPSAWLKLFPPPPFS